MSTRVAIIAAAFNERIVGTMIRAAEEEVRKEGGDVTTVVKVPGCYEIPLTVQSVLQRETAALVVTLGFIERGETLHGEVIGHAVHRALLDLQLRFSTPIGIGIIGPGATDAQAEARKESYARAAVQAAFAHMRVLKELAP